MIWSKEVQNQFRRPSFKNALLNLSANTLGQFSQPGMDWVCYLAGSFFRALLKDSFLYWFRISDSDQINFGNLRNILPLFCKKMSKKRNEMLEIFKGIIRLALTDPQKLQETPPTKSSIVDTSTKYSTKYIFLD